MIIRHLLKRLNQLNISYISLIFMSGTLIGLVGCQTTGSIKNDASHHARKSMQSELKTAARPRYANTVQDSAPSGPPPTRFKAVKPVAEPMSRYGNPATYHVDGQRYDVLTTATGYRQRGLASWYGTKFHSRRTSSGEHYDMYALTAAHKTLPLPTYVRVKNLKNGREAIVKVNDRGPFHSGRIMDLSYGAAVKLGIFPQGTAPVEIEALTLKNQHAQYYVQAGAFTSNQLAEQLKAKLSKLSTSPVFIKKEQRRYLVRVGPFANRQMTEHLKRKLTNGGVHGAFSMIM